METKGREPRKNVIYQQGIPDDEPWRTLEEIGEEVGVSKNYICQILNGALQKVATQVLWDMHGKAPDPHHVKWLSKDLEFNRAVSDVMWEDHHRAAAAQKKMTTD